jgi:hypothetical protein
MGITSGREELHAGIATAIAFTLMRAARLLELVPADDDN